MKIRRCVWEMEKSGLKNVIRELTFDAYTASKPWQQTIKAGAMNYADTLEGWLLFCGQSGSGKTHLCTAVCRQRLLSGDEVRYMPWRDKIAELKSMSLDSERRSEIIASYKTAEILYIDDLFKVGKAADGTCNPTGADISIAFEIINHRYINHLPTIVSTEKTPQELVEIDEATGSRIIEMAGVNVFLVTRDQKRNYRLRGVQAV
jgi:DNA replication protein DnaC